MIQQITINQQEKPLISGQVHASLDAWGSFQVTQTIANYLMLW
jgi:hypothetical protein